MGGINTETLLLSSYFLFEFKQKELDSKNKDILNNYIKRIFSQFEFLLRKGNGLDFEYLLNKIENSDKNSVAFPFQMFTSAQLERIENLNDVIVKDKNELINFYEFYYHPQLQITSKPPVYKMDYDTGELSLYKIEDYFLEMKDSYTIDNLIDYFIKKTGLYYDDDIVFIKRKQLETEIKNIIKNNQNFSLDNLLFCIDASTEISEDENLGKITFINQVFHFQEQAKEYYSRRKNILKEEGDDRIVPRKNSYSKRYEIFRNGPFLSLLQ